MTSDINSEVTNLFISPDAALGFSLWQPFHASLAPDGIQSLYGNPGLLVTRASPDGIAWSPKNPIPLTGFAVYTLLGIPNGDMTAAVLGINNGDGSASIDSSQVATVTYTASQYIYASSAITVTMKINQNDSGGSVITTLTSPTHAVLANSWTPITYTFEVPIGTTTISMAIAVSDSAPLQYTVAGSQLEIGTERSLYTDGGQVRCRWLGVPNASASYRPPNSSVAEVLSDTTERIYAKLPRYLRVADRQQNFTLKTYLASMSERLGELEFLKTAFDAKDPDEGGIREGETSGLVDPRVADVSWLPWLGQLVGLHFDANASEDDKRAAIASASGGWLAGTKQAMIAAAQTVLTGAQYVNVFDHTTDSSDVGAATVWDVLVVSRSSETPGGGDSVLSAIRSARAQPVGVTLWWIGYDASWADLVSAYPLWSDRQRAGTWQKWAEAGLT